LEASTAHFAPSCFVPGGHRNGRNCRFFLSDEQGIGRIFAISFKVLVVKIKDQVVFFVFHEVLQVSCTCHLINAETGSFGAFPFKRIFPYVHGT
jgi:hypothetical protein